MPNLWSNLWSNLCVGHCDHSRPIRPPFHWLNALHILEQISPFNSVGRVIHFFPLDKVLYINFALILAWLEGSVCSQFAVNMAVLNDLSQWLVSLTGQVAGWPCHQVVLSRFWPVTALWPTLFVVWVNKKCRTFLHGKYVLVQLSESVLVQF